MLTNTRTRLSLAAMAALLSACAAPYKRAEGPDLATVRIENGTSQFMRVMESKKGDCSDLTNFDGIHESIERGQSRSTVVQPKVNLVLVIAGNVSVAAGSGLIFSSCSLNVGFKPEPNGVYELRYENSGAGCALRARMRTGEGWRPLQLTPIRVNRILAISCTPDERQQ